MTTNVARWEWRAFGTRFGAAEDAITARSSGETQQSDELYVLSTGGANVKVRDDLMDVKVLQEVDAWGLERWEPVMKRGSPLSASDVSRVFEALAVPPPPLGGHPYSLDRFVSELVEQSEHLRTVEVHKRRVRSTLDGCMAEIADVTADGRRLRTIAIESEDATAVIAAVRATGLDGYVNTSYPRELTALIHDEPERVAAIDVGTNSIKFHIGERGSDGRVRTMVDRVEMTRLGQDLEERGRISDEPLERTVAAIAEMVQEARRHDVRAIVAVGTAGLRIADNRDDVIAAIRSGAGITVEVIPGQEEGRLAYIAVLGGLGLPEASIVVFDTGGGSTQFTFGRGRQVNERFSVEVGAVRYTERFGLADAVAPEALREAVEAISADLTRIGGRPPPDALVAMGGAVTNLAAVKHGLAVYDPDVVQGTILDRPEIDRQIELYRSQDAQARRSIVGLQPERADIILAGACIVLTVMRELGQQAVTVSDRGLRHGLLFDRFGP